MPRIARMLNKDEKTVYHIISRSALDGFPFGEIEKEELANIIKECSSIYLVDIIGFCILGNHFHLLVKMYPGHDLTDKEVRERFARFYGDGKKFVEEEIEYYREKWSSLSEFVMEIKQVFSRFYNKQHRRRGTLWGERFKTVILEEGDALANCLAWSSLGHHFQTGNQDGFLSTDFGPVEFNVMDEDEKLRRYRRYVYEAGALNMPDKSFPGTVENEAAEKEEDSEFNLNRIKRFKSRTRYFSDSGIIGSKKFVALNYQRFKNHFQCKHEKKPKPIKGLDGVYSLKRLSELL